MSSCEDKVTETNNAWFLVSNGFDSQSHEIFFFLCRVITDVEVFPDPTHVPSCVYSLPYRPLNKCGLNVTLKKLHCNICYYRTCFGNKCWICVCGDVVKIVDIHGLLVFVIVTVSVTAVLLQWRAFWWQNIYSGFISQSAFLVFKSGPSYIAQLQLMCDCVETL